MKIRRMEGREGADESFKPVVARYRCSGLTMLLDDDDGVHNAYSLLYIHCYYEERRRGADSLSA